jgi:hypothetical protein
MKKILLTIGLIAATSAAFAQGYINFAPGTSSWVSTNATSYSSLFGGGSTGGGTIGFTAGTANGFYYELLMQHWTGTTPTDLNVWDGTWKDTGLKDTNSTVSVGRIFGGPTGLNVGGLVGWNNTPIGTPGTFPAGTNYIILVGWSASLGTSWLDVSNACVVAAANPSHYFTTPGFFGITGIGWENPNLGAPGIAVLGAGANAGGQPIVIANGLTLFEVPVPEPATFALVGLGGLSLLLFRRRN